MTYIIVSRPGRSVLGRGGRGPRFFPHYNSAMGKYYHSSRDMVSDMKAKGLEFVRDSSIDHKVERKPYKVSEKTREVVNAIKSQTDSKGRFRPSDRLLDTLERSRPRVDHQKIRDLDPSKGGFVTDSKKRKNK